MQATPPCSCKGTGASPAPVSVPTAPAPASRPATALAGNPVFTNHDGTPQGILAANPLTKALLDAAQAASPTAADTGKAKYLPHKYILKPGVRSATSVDNLSFAEFIHSYLRMLEAMLEAQENILDRLEFLIRLVSEVTHNKWHDVRELYMLFEQEVIKGTYVWSDKWEGQLEKMAYSGSKQKVGNVNAQGGGAGGYGNHGSHGNHGKASKGLVACKDWNWKETCMYAEEVCKFDHVCFLCVKKGLVREHKGKECPTRGTAQSTAPPSGNQKL